MRIESRFLRIAVVLFLTATFSTIAVLCSGPNLPINVIVGDTSKPSLHKQPVSDVKPDGEGALPEGVSQDWWSQVQENIRKEGYSITKKAPASEKSGPSWSASNPAHGFRTDFTENGFSLSPIKEGSCWTWGLALVGLQADGSSKVADREKDKATTRVSGSRIEFDRGWITEWFVNDERGLEQGFTIYVAPKGRVDSSEPAARERPPIVDCVDQMVDNKKPLSTLL